MYYLHILYSMPIPVTLQLNCRYARAAIIAGEIEKKERNSI